MVAIFKTIAVVATIAVASVQATPSVQPGMVRGEIMKRAGICFDFFDCLLQGGGDCVFASGQFLGTCVVKGSSSSVKAASTTKKATSSSKKATATSSASAAAGTGICFDFFDCLLFGGGDCVNFKCVKKA